MKPDLGHIVLFQNAPSLSWLRVASVLLIAGVLAGCTQLSRLPSGEMVVHTNQWGESNRTIKVYGTGRVPNRAQPVRTWKTYTWNGSSYVCTGSCTGMEAPIRHFTWPTPRYTSPFTRTQQADRRFSQNTIPLAPNRTIFGISGNTQTPFVRRLDQQAETPSNVIPLVPNTPINDTVPSSYTLPRATTP